MRDRAQALLNQRVEDAEDVSEIYDSYVIFIGVVMNPNNHPDIEHRFYDEVTITPVAGGYKLHLIQTAGEEPIDIFIGE